MTEKILDWLNHNRFRAYPFVNDAGLVSGGVRIPDCVLLDCVVMDTRHGISSPELVFKEIDVTNERTRVAFEYNGTAYSHTLTGGGGSSDLGESSIVRVDGTSIGGLASEMLFVKLVFSSHDYILENAGTGHWNFTGRVLPSKVMAVTASGVEGLHVNGSAHVQGFEGHGVARGDVTLVDGFRTQPAIQNGKILVKVGTNYGEDPCHYRENDAYYVGQTHEQTSCDDLMFFFCGQNAIDTGDVVFEGGPGITVKQGGTYAARYAIINTYGEVGIEAGERVPCIEVVATPGLLKLYRPSASAESPEQTM